MALKKPLRGTEHQYKNSNKSIVWCFLVLLLFCTDVLLANYNPSFLQKKRYSLTSTKKTKQNPPGGLTSSITYQADSLIKQDVLNNRIELFGNAKLNFEENELTAAYISIDNNTGLITARGVYDSNGIYAEKPVFKQKGQESVQDSINYNFKSKKAKVWNVSIEYQDLVIKGAANKVVNDSVLFFEDIRFTTSKKEKPDYFIKTNKAKYIKDKLLIAGFSQLYIADVPTPIVLPFAYIPLNKTRASGVLIPSWGDSAEEGFFLQNGGYYFAINDQLDLELTGDIFTNGRWGLRANSNYKKRYKFGGNIGMSVENIIGGTRGLSDYSKRTNYNLTWNHNQDSKSNPNSTLSASVNIASSDFFRQSLNQLNNDSFLNNTLNSSITYSRNFQGTPFNTSATLSQTINTNTEVINMNLPSLQVNMQRIFPFAGKAGKKDNAWQKTGVSYTFSAENRINTNDDDFLTSKMLDSLQSGVKQNIDISTNFKAFKHFAVTPSINYDEVWYFDRINRFFDSGSSNVVTDTISKFSTYRDVSASVSLNTKFYGLYNFKKGPYSAVLHTITPSISYNFRPDLSGIYDEEYQVSSDPTDIQSYSPFEGGIYGTPNSSLSNSIGINIVNNFEAKLQPKEKNDRTPAKKVTLLNNLNFSSSYNMAADSLRWSPWNANTGFNLFKNKLTVNMSATLDPYTINSNGTRINKYTIDNNEGLFRVTGANLNANSSFSSADIWKKKTNTNKTQNNASSNTNNQLNSNSELNLFNYKIPWTLNLGYNLVYNNSNRQNDISSNSLTFSGDIELTPKWSVGYSSGYDFVNEGFTFTTLDFTRDLDSWVMRFNWVPFGDRQTYYFFIGVKSSMLEDLQYEQRGLPNNTLF